MQQFDLAERYVEASVFCAVVECGSFTKASTKLGIAQSTVSNKVQALEAYLGYALMTRSTRNIKITTLGLKLYDFVVQQQKLFNEYIQLQQSQKETIHGKVRLVLPEIVSYKLVTPHIGEFLQKHQNLELEIYYQHTELNLFKEKFDLAVVNHIPKQQTIKLKYLGKQQIFLYCTKEYIKRYGLLTNLEDLENHLYTGPINHSYNAEKTVNFISQKYGNLSLENTARLKVTSMLSAKQLAINGHVIAGGTDMLFAQELENETFIKLLPNISAGEFSYYLLRLPQHDNAAIHCVADFIEKCFAKIR